MLKCLKIINREDFWQEILGLTNLSLIFIIRKKNDYTEDYKHPLLQNFIPFGFFYAKVCAALEIEKSMNRNTLLTKVIVDYIYIFFVKYKQVIFIHTKIIEKDAFNILNSSF